MAETDASAGGSTADKGATKAGGATAETPKIDLDLTRDTVTRGDKTTGLGRVLVQTDSNALADDIADLVLGALRRKGVATPWRIRVVEDPSVVRGAELLRLLEAQAATLTAALDAVVPEDVAKAKAVGGAAITTTLEAVGALSKLFAHDYQLSGREIPVDGLGFDLLVAEKLQFKYDGVDVSVDRMLPMPESAIFHAIATLDRRRHLALAPLLAGAGAAMSASAAAVEDADSTRDALQALALKVAEKLDTGADQFKALRDEFKTATRSLAEARATAAKARADYDALAALDKAVADFVDAATAQPADGSRPAVVVAARAEAFVKDATHLLYVKLVAGGADEIVDERALRADTWTALAGASAEYLLLDGDTVLVSGARSALQATTAKLKDLESLTQRRVAYVGVPDFHA